MVKSGSVTAEIFLIWTNVIRTNVAWTNVTMIVGIVPRWPQEPTYSLFKIGSITAFLICTLRIT